MEIHADTDPKLCPESQTLSAKSGSKGIYSKLSGTVFKNLESVKCNKICYSFTRSVLSMFFARSQDAEQSHPDYAATTAVYKKYIEELHNELLIFVQCDISSN